jgi:hypothetical protein
MTLHATSKNSLNPFTGYLLLIDLESQESRHRIHDKLGDVLNGFGKRQRHEPLLRLLCTFCGLTCGKRLLVGSIAAL